MSAQLVTNYTPVEMDQRALVLKNVTISLVESGQSDQEIKKFLKRKYKVDNEQYAQNILDYVTEDWY